ncbi:MAG TPA: AbrB/MazE/SpoVT family DNA-binding domain-containing protein [Cyanobacteria bacterium UBA11369]|nr:AbrB/MazE/SpoVT family DNA-binding domain-containing protein [Cyanobacteria bacterium UBA11371]HBE36977.1 AbrB/MazE/SpoVT family DNA-binding domain-containing protein [Cyanobacteria bacterium UBA11368]HBE48843.1 AbrB/MazE/SpoVT family DNA-binding domain-containing protein [Cyanobacteria bacterium UBA11369]
MGTVIRTRLVKVGNSQGIRIPKPVLEQSGISEELEIEVHDTYLIIRAAPKSRIGWDKAFAVMAERQDDILLDSETTTEWDRLEWEW